MRQIIFVLLLAVSFSASAKSKDASFKKLVKADLRQKSKPKNESREGYDLRNSSTTYSASEVPTFQSPSDVSSFNDSIVSYLDVNVTNDTCAHYLEQ